MTDWELALAIAIGIWTAFGLLGGWLFLRSQGKERKLYNSDILTALLFVLCGPGVPLILAGVNLGYWLLNWLENENEALTKLFGDRRIKGEINLFSTVEKRNKRIRGSGEYYYECPLCGNTFAEHCLESDEESDGSYHAFYCDVCDIRFYGHTAASKNKGAFTITTPSFFKANEVSGDSYTIKRKQYGREIEE